MKNIPHGRFDDHILHDISKKEQAQFLTLYDLGWADMYIEEEDRDTSVYISEQGFEAGDGNEYKYLVLGSYDDEEKNQIRYAQFTNSQEVYDYWEQVLKDQGI